LKNNYSVPFADLYRQYISLQLEIDQAISEVIKQSTFIRGPYVEKFESDFAGLLGIKNCISTANGTDSLYIAMKCLGLSSGEEVIVPAHSWISTSETVTQSGGKTVFCDTDKNSFTIDPFQIESKITSKTVGIIPVHLYGQSAEMDIIISIAKKYNLWVLEDCAQAHLAKYKSKLVGSFGEAASFSFYPGKNLGAMGDAGALVTNNSDLACKMQIFARHGGTKKGEHLIEGINSRMDGFQAAILSIKMKHLLGWNEKRRKIAQVYIDELANIENLTLPTVLDGREHVWHLFVIKTPLRDKLFEHLKSKKIQTVINYPIALPFLEAYKYLNHSVSEFPNAYENQSKILSLPIFPEMTENEQEIVIHEIKHFFNNNCI
jgi:dTDP-4-amino-4,6-dideoxygalactose transaminase